MFTPMSTASTAAGPLGATSGTNTRVAGRLLTTLASTAATTANPSSAGSPEPDGNTAPILSATPFCMTACTTTPNASTNTRNGTFTARTIATAVVWRRGRLRTALTAAPASAPPRAQGDPPTARRPPRRFGDDEPGQRQRHHHQRKHRRRRRRFGLQAIGLHAEIATE